MGDGKDVWAKVVPEVARQHRVLVYDRPGYGDSRKTTTPRDPCTIAAQQRALLAQAGLKPPYVLVGHGLGGLYQYVYARLYPQDVAGLVLLDPTHPQQWNRMQTDASTYAMLVKTRRKLMFNSTESAEFDAQTQCLQHVDMASPLRVPAMLLVRDKFGIEEMGSFENVVRAQERIGSACPARRPSSASRAPATTSRKTTPSSSTRRSRWWRRRSSGVGLRGVPPLIRPTPDLLSRSISVAKPRVIRQHRASTVAPD